MRRFGTGWRVPVQTPRRPTSPDRRPKEDSGVLGRDVGRTVALRGGGGKVGRRRRRQLARRYYKIKNLPAHRAVRI